MKNSHKNFVRLCSIKLHHKTFLLLSWDTNIYFNWNHIRHAGFSFCVIYFQNQEKHFLSVAFQRILFKESNMGADSFCLAFCINPQYNQYIRELSENTLTVTCVLNQEPKVYELVKVFVVHNFLTLYAFCNNLRVYSYSFINDLS